MINEEIDRMKKWQKERTALKRFQTGKSLMCGGCGIVILSIPLFSLKDIASIPVAVPITFIVIGLIGSVLGCYLIAK